jgi:hypothetical protein
MWMQHAGGSSAAAIQLCVSAHADAAFPCSAVQLLAAHKRDIGYTHTHTHTHTYTHTHTQAAEDSDASQRRRITPCKFVPTKSLTLAMQVSSLPPFACPLLPPLPVLLLSPTAPHYVTPITLSHIHPLCFSSVLASRTQEPMRPRTLLRPAPYTLPNPLPRHLQTLNPWSATYLQQDASFVKDVIKDLPGVDSSDPRIHHLLEKYAIPDTKPEPLHPRPDTRP